jgi:hypothetical protein
MDIIMDIWSTYEDMGKEHSDIVKHPKADR